LPARFDACWQRPEVMPSSPCIVSWTHHLPAFPQPKPKRDNIKTKLQKMAARLIKRKKE
jgi:hypothetical protein